MESITQNNGVFVTITGIGIVFLGLILIALTIYLFNIFSQKFLVESSNTVSSSENNSETVSTPKKERIIVRDVDDDTLVAIATAVEIYRRLHYDNLDGRITFRSGKEKSAWKTGYKFGLRS